MNDEFYIGYLDRSPPGLARHTRRVVIAVGLLALLLMAAVAGWQSAMTPGRFEFGVRRTFEGIFLAQPLPILRQVAADGSVTAWLLVGEGKFGLPPGMRERHGQPVRITGSLVESGRRIMIEVAGMETFNGEGGSASVAPVEVADLGDVVLSGELVDTKCHYGVMRPDTGKVHRACAVRCLAGGVPPGLLLRSAEGDTSVVLLTGPGGAEWQFDPQWAARRMQVGGHLTLRDGQAYLAVVRMRLID